jgi:hypothetical protein
MKVRTGIMVNRPQGNTAFSAYISLTGWMIQAGVIGRLKKSVRRLAESNRTHWTIVLTLSFFSEFRKIQELIQGKLHNR